MATTWYAQKSDDTDAANVWNDQADGLGNWLTWGNLAADDVLDTNAYTIELNVASFTCATIRNTTAAGGFTCDRTAGANRTFTCDVTAGAATCLVCTGSTYTLTVIGNVIGGSGSADHGIDPSGSNSLTVTGNVTGGSNGAAYGVGRGGSASNISVSGNALAATGEAIQVGYQSTLTVSGNITAVNGVATITYYSGYYTLVLGGNLVCAADGTLPVNGSSAGMKLKLTGTGTGATQQYRDGSLDPLTCKVPDYPAEADVKLAVDYDYSALTGTYAAAGGLLTHPGMAGGARG